MTVILHLKKRKKKLILAQEMGIFRYQEVLYTDREEFSEKRKD